MNRRFAFGNRIRRSDGFENRIAHPRCRKIIYHHSSPNRDDKTRTVRCRRQRRYATVNVRVRGSSRHDRRRHRCRRRCLRRRKTGRSLCCRHRRLRRRAGGLQTGNRREQNSAPRRSESDQNIRASRSRRDLAVKGWAVVSTKALAAGPCGIILYSIFRLPFCLIKTTRPLIALSFFIMRMESKYLVPKPFLAF